MVWLRCRIPAYLEVGRRKNKVIQRIMLARSLFLQHLESNL